MPDPRRFDFPSVFGSARRVIRDLGTDTPKVVAFRSGLANEVLETHKDREIYGRSGLALYNAVVKCLGPSAEQVLSTGDLPPIIDALRRLNKPITTNIAINDERWLLKAFQETFRDYPAISPTDARDLRARAVELLTVHNGLVGKFPAEPFLAYIVACVIREKTLGMEDVGRVTVCWVCRLTVMEAFNPSCPKCRWMICVCGSCAVSEGKAHPKAMTGCDQPSADWFLRICDVIDAPNA